MLRRITSEDQDLFITMAREFYSSPAVSHSIPKTHHQMAFREMTSGSRFMWGYFLEHQEETAGYAIISQTYSHEAGGLVWWLEEIYVRPAFQGRGLGHQYLNTIIEQAREQKIARLRLEVEPDNLRAKALYKALGFQDLEYRQMVWERSEKALSKQ